MCSNLTRKGVEYEKEKDKEKSGKEKNFG